MKKWLKRLAILAAILILLAFFIRNDGIQYTMAYALGSFGNPYFNADLYAAEKNCDGAAQCASGPLRVMTYNVLCRICDKNRPTFDPWTERLPYLCERIAKYDPDLLGMQELGGYADLEDFRKAFPQYDYVTYKFGKWAYGDCALYYRKDRFEVLDSGQMWLSPKPTLPFALAWKASMPRYVNWAYMRQKKDGFLFLYLNTHFDNATVNKEPAAVLFAKTFNPIAAKMPVIVTGDFNTNSTTQRYKNIIGEGPGKLEDTYDLAPSKELLNEPASKGKEREMDGYDNALMAIDHIFVGGPGKKEVFRWVIDSTLYGPDKKSPSDHPSVFAEFNLGLRP
jgi:endonuclease/exonuclease/phosphatase family metal-dependent hydrolase